ncbi:hypothetical protein [Pedobacter sp. BMA]|uniref:hypothetical protein n=1 Tax=Pedobacter sp. BMA TaxID=1663685 RepID=UPI00064AFD5F|nr:hypothetical protein [Pedobacter sp. BMA]KLT66727.1 hypothetical protein AB669_06075 [Pedobacter sp. BMA]
MSRRKQIRSKEQFDAALELEKSGDTGGAMKLYQKATVTDPANHHAWNRLMIIYRKTRSGEDEVKLIKLAISSYQGALHSKQEEWAKQNSEKAESSRELAKVLGLLEPTGLPKNDDTTIEKWQTRLYLLEYRIKNARKTKPAKKKPKAIKPKPKRALTKAKQKPKRTTTKPGTKK